ncbi:hypothetical protein O9992_22045 [Vibrio lentus]|nr:hypothetical protein [Vibrio lentus]
MLVCPLRIRVLNINSLRPNVSLSPCDQHLFNHLLELACEPESGNTESPRDSDDRLMVCLDLHQVPNRRRYFAVSVRKCALSLQLYHANGYSLHNFEISVLDSPEAALSNLNKRGAS